MVTLGIQKLWYIKLGDEIHGPFPAKIITERLLLNRATINDLVSLDKQGWLPISEFAELLPLPMVNEKEYSSEAEMEVIQWRNERIKASKRWMDERAGERREETAITLETEDENSRTQSDRRKIVMTGNARWHPSKYLPAPKNSKHHYVGGIILLVLLSAALYLGDFVLAPVNPVKVDIGTVSLDCGKPAKPNVNWRSCDKQGIWLEGANLSGANLAFIHFNSTVLKKANLSSANLTGADLSYASLIEADLSSSNLQQANLSNADLQGVNLRNADMREANLTAVALAGAKLDNAVWPDGKICASGSTGQCL